MTLGREGLDRIDVQNDPVNWVDPWGLHHFSGPIQGTPTVTACHPSETNPLITISASGTIGTFDFDGGGHTTDLGGASIDITVGDEGKYEVVVGVSRREGVGVHLNENGSPTGISVHIGKSLTQSPVTFSISDDNANGIDDTLSDALDLMMEDKCLF